MYSVTDRQKQPKLMRSSVTSSLDAVRTEKKRLDAVRIEKTRSE